MIWDTVEGSEKTDTSGELHCLMFTLAQQDKVNQLILTRMKALYDGRRIYDISAA